MENIKPSIIESKVPESNERYQKDKQEIYDANINTTSFLGSFELAFIQDINDIEDASNELKLFYEKNIRYLRHKLEDLLFNFNYFEPRNEKLKKREEYIFNEIISMLNVPEIQEELENHLGNDRSIYHLRKKIFDMSDKLIYTVCKQHAENIKKQKAQLEQRSKEIKIEFKIAIVDAVSTGMLPETVLNALNRIDYVTVNIVDTLLDINNNTLGSINDFGIIKISSAEIENSKLKNILFHEFLHEISGKSITMMKQINETYSFDYFVNRKLGISLKNEHCLSKNKNTWLNEAITEWLTIKLSGYEKNIDEYAYKGSYSYTNERKELDRLLELGLKEDVLINAYFENFSSEQEKDENGRYFSKLIQQINTIEGKYGFTKLENKYIFQEIIDTINQRIGFLVEDINIQKDLLSPEAKILKINISVGKTQETLLTKQFIYKIPFFNNEIIDINSIKTTLRDLNLLIEETNQLYKGKVKITFSEE